MLSTAKVEVERCFDHRAHSLQKKPDQHFTTPYSKPTLENDSARWKSERLIKVCNKFTLLIKPLQ